MVSFSIKYKYMAIRSWARSGTAAAIHFDFSTPIRMGIDLRPNLRSPSMEWKSFTMLGPKLVIEKAKGLYLLV